MEQDRESKSAVSWESFDVCVSETFKNLIFDTDFTDVTLVCDDEKQIDAHKVILSNASEFFRRILVRNPHQKPLLYLKGMKYEDVRSIIEFTYLGQTELFHDRINRFIKTAAELEIKGVNVNIDMRGIDEKLFHKKHTEYSNNIFPEEVLMNLDQIGNEMEKPEKENLIKTVTNTTKIEFNLHE